MTRAELELLADLVAARVADRLRTIVGPPHVPGALARCLDTDRPLALLNRIPRHPRERLKAGQALYVVHQEGTNLVKIGVAANVTKRLTQLQGGNPYPLSLVATVRGNISERRLHQTLAALRVRGEWFRAEDLMKKWLLAEHRVRRGPGWDTFWSGAE